MPANEIKELRKSGRLEEAYAMAKAELADDSTNIWGKRNLSWVLYSQLEALSSNLDAFISKINEVKELNLPATEEMFFDSISIVIAKAARAITHEIILDINKINCLFESIRTLPIKRNSKWFSVLFKALHKGMKESNKYIEFADWWDFNNFKPEDYQKETMPNGKEVMSIAEQAYIAYSKHLLPKKTQQGGMIFNKKKAEEFIPLLSQIVEDYPQFQYPAYFNAKLLLALGNKDNMLESLLPFAKKKRNDFWVWEILAEAFLKNPENVLSCYCRALLCSSPEEMLVNLRIKLAKILIEKKLYDEAKTEIELSVKARSKHGFKIPLEIVSFQTFYWYKNANSSSSNNDFYKLYSQIADSLLYSDVPEEFVIVEFVNTDKKMLNFIASETKFGFFKYERFFSNLKIGDTLKVRFQGGSNEGMHQVYTAFKVNNDDFKKHFIKEVSGIVTIPLGKSFGFINDIFIPPTIVSKLKLIDGMPFKGQAIKSYKKEKKQWSWKII